MLRYMKEVPAKVQMYVGQTHDGTAFTEMEYNPYAGTVTFRDHEGNQITLEPSAMSKMVDQLSTFVKLLQTLGVHTK
jgi:hypothetical protein